MEFKQQVQDSRDSFSKPIENGFTAHLLETTEKTPENTMCTDIVPTKLNKEPLRELINTDKSQNMSINKETAASNWKQTLQVLTNKLRSKQKPVNYPELTSHNTSAQVEANNAQNNTILPETSVFFKKFNNPTGTTHTPKTVITIKKAEPKKDNDRKKIISRTSNKVWVMSSSDETLLNPCLLPKRKRLFRRKRKKPPPPKQKSRPKKKRPPPSIRKRLSPAPPKKKTPPRPKRKRLLRKPSCKIIKKSALLTEEDMEIEMLEDFDDEEFVMQSDGSVSDCDDLIEISSDLNSEEDMNIEMLEDFDDEEYDHLDEHDDSIQFSKEGADGISDLVDTNNDENQEMNKEKLLHDVCEKADRDGHIIDIHDEQMTHDEQIIHDDLIMLDDYAIHDQLNKHEDQIIHDEQNIHDEKIIDNEQIVNVEQIIMQDGQTLHIEQFKHDDHIKHEDQIIHDEQNIHVEQNIHDEQIILIEHIIQDVEVNTDQDDGNLESLEDVKEAVVATATTAPLTPKTEAPRFTKKGTVRKYKKYSDEAMMQCVAAVNSGELTIRMASVKFNVPRKCIEQKLRRERQKLRVSKEVFSFDSPEQEAIYFDRLKFDMFRHDLIQILHYTNVIPFRNINIHIYCLYCNPDARGKVFEDFEELRTHFRTEHLYDKVSEISDIVTSRWKHEVVKVDIENLHCKKCSIPLTEWDDLFVHMNKAHGLCLEEGRKKVIPFLIKPTIKCVFCDEQTQNLHRLDVHMNCHYDNFICDDCGRTFIAKTRMLRHSKTHGKDHAFPCEICGKTFTRDIYRNRHVQNVHMRQIFIKCFYCDERVRGEHQRHRHVLEHHKDKVQIFTCEYCDKTFTFRPTYLNHIRKVHERWPKIKEKKVHFCTLCNKKYTSVARLKRHMAANHEEEDLVVLEVVQENNEKM